MGQDMMNNSQTVFFVFLAIFWGLIGNVQPRWKPFQLPLFFDLRWARRRALFAIVIFNVLPLATLILVLYLLNESSDVQRSWRLIEFTAFVGRSVLPAFAVFGFYRLWLALIEIWPRYFYARNQKELPETIQQIKKGRDATEPTLDQLGIKEISNNGGKNLLCAILYFAVAVSSLVYCR